MVSVSVKFQVLVELKFLVVVSVSVELKFLVSLSAGILGIGTTLERPSIYASTAITRIIKEQNINVLVVAQYDMNPRI